MGGVVLAFGEIPFTARDEVVLPEAVLGRVERHALAVAAHREALLGAGQHLKRGLLLYGYLRSTGTRTHPLFDRSA